MRQNSIKTISAITAILLLGASVTGCATTADKGIFAAPVSTANSAATAGSTSGIVSASNPATTNTAAASGSTSSAASSSIIDRADIFTERDLQQTADFSETTAITLVSGQDVMLTEKGVYVLSGEAADVTIIVDAEDAKVQLVLDGVRITNADAPAIYSKSADKVFVTTTDHENALTVTGSFVADGDTNLDAVIFAKSDLTLNGTGSLEIVSSKGNGISTKDTLKITGGAYDIQAAADALEANDAILIGGGDLTIEAGKDALHSEHDEDATLGYIYIQGGSLKISAADDAIRGNSFVQIDGGTIDITTSTEGVEANRIQVNGGEITLYAKDDGFNATPKVNAAVLIELNGGTIHVRVGSGDTDAFDSNGNIIINGGTIAVQANSAFDSDGAVAFNAGDVSINGVKVTQITSVQGGPGGMGGGKVRR